MAMTSHFKTWFNIVAAAAMCTVCILLALPRDAKFGYDYNLEQPWHYPSLIATYEFPIYKSSEQLKAERDSVVREFYPYFNVSHTVAAQQIKNFKADHAKGRFAGVPNSYVGHALGKLNEVYAAGVVEPDVLTRLSEQKTGGVRIVSGTNAAPKPVNALYSPRTAYEYLMMPDDNFSRDIMGRLNLHDYLTPNLVYDSLKTRESIEEQLSSISPNTGMVLAGERIIDRGERVSRRQLAILDSLRQESERRKEDDGSLMLVRVGQLGMIAAIVIALIIYLRMFRRDLFRSPHAFYLIFTLVTLFPVFTSLLMTYKFFSVYVIPFAMVPIIVRVFMDTRTAFITHVTMVALSSMPLHANHRFVLIQILAGLTAIYCIKELTERSQILRTAFIITLCTWAFGFCYELAQGASTDNIDSSWYFYIGINGVLLLFTYPFLYLIERLFGFTSSVTLIEMSNINSPLIRRMAKEAQGTFVHSMQVGNLAAEVAAKIDAKVQLVRTGALYHDIGKMINPAFFTENQGALNPHDQLTEERSAEIIISHVTEGMRMAEKYHLPKVIRDFIITHHGRSLVKYFYIQACNKHGEENVDKEAFIYPGRNPFTREQGILMMADAIEASSRSLKEYSEETISKLVNRIVDAQMAEGYLKECPLTFRDIAEAKATFIESLKTIYHTRIAYPEMKPAISKEEKNTGKPRFFGGNWTWKK